MRATMAVFIVSTVAVVLQAQIDPPVRVYSFADQSCGEWVKSASDKETRALYQFWFRGFVSGYNYATPDNQVVLERMPDMDTLSLYIDKYCREKPLNGFTGAAFDFVKEQAVRPGRIGGASNLP